MLFRACLRLESRLGTGLSSGPLSPCGRGWRRGGDSRAEPGEGASSHDSYEETPSPASPLARLGTLSRRGRGEGLAAPSVVSPSIETLQDVVSSQAASIFNRALSAAT